MHIINNNNNNKKMNNLKTDTIISNSDRLEQYKNEIVVTDERKNSTNDSNTIDYDLDLQIQQTRKELERLKTKRQEERHEWKQDLQYHAKQLHTAQETLQDRLKNIQYNNNKHKHNHANTSSTSSTNHYPFRKFITDCLKEHYLKRRRLPLPPLYVFHQEVALLSAMVMTFSGLEKQIHMIQSQSKELEEYLELQRNQILEQWEDINRLSVDRVSLVAEKNNACYDHYQTQLDTLERDIRFLRKQQAVILQQEQTSNSNKTKDDDDCTVTSETEHSILSDEGDEGSLIHLYRTGHHEAITCSNVRDSSGAMTISKNNNKTDIIIHNDSNHDNNNNTSNNHETILHATDDSTFNDSSSSAPLGNYITDLFNSSLDNLFRLSSSASAVGG